MTRTALDYVIPAAAIAAGLAAPPAWSAGGSLDPAFGDVGRVDLPANVSGAVWSLEALDNGGYGHAAGDDFCYYYFSNYCDTDLIDFGGQVTSGGLRADGYSMSLPADLQIGASAWTPDGRLIGAGWSPTASVVRVFRLDAAGLLDPTFGTAGYVDIGSRYDQVTAVVVDTDGSIVVLREGNGTPTMTRLTKDGVLDPSFGTSGVAQAGAGVAPAARRDVVRREDGAYWFLGASATNDCRLLGLTGVGALDPRLGASGALDVHAGPGPTLLCTSLAGLPDGGVLVGGQSAGTGALVRVAGDGTLDGTFSSDIGGYLGSIADVTTGTGGTVYAAGTDVSGAPGAIVTRLTPSGAVDVTFGDAGRAWVDPQSEFYETVKVTLVSAQRPGEVVVAGSVVGFASFERPFMARLMTTGDGPGVIGIRTAQVTATESDGEAQIVVRRTGGSQGPASVAFHVEPAAFYSTPATAGTDYTPVSGQLDWADGDTSERIIRVPILADPASFETTEALIVRLDPSGGTGIGRRSGLVIIPGDGYPYGAFKITTDTLRVIETGTARFVVWRENGSQGAVSVRVVPVSGTATAGRDFVATEATLTWADGDTAPKEFTVSVSADSEREPNESFTVELRDPTGGAILEPASSAGVQVSDAPKSRGSGGGSTGPAALMLLALSALARRLRHARS